MLKKKHLNRAIMPRQSRSQDFMNSGLRQGTRSEMLPSTVDEAGLILQQPP